MKDYEPYYTEDGSIGLYSYADKDVYHSKFGALTEAWEKFVIPSGIDKILKDKNELKVLDICYGIGYNTKALMSYVINLNKNKLKKKKFFEKNKNIKFKYNNGIVSIDDNNIPKGINSETLYTNNKVQIDCLDINEELIKLSPFFITLKTPEEIFSKFVPDIFDCFETYYKLRDLFSDCISFFYPKNRLEITELLELKFKNMHIDKEYKVNGLVNYILINKLSEIYGRDYPDKTIKEIVTRSKYRRFFDNSPIKYAKFNQKWGYKTSSAYDLSTFLHNIYYSYLSKRNKNIDFKAAQSLFNINFYLKDARKTILNLNEQYDCVFLDAFTYTKAPQLWSVEFISELYRLLSNDGLLLTYSNSVLVRNTLLEAGFYVGKIYNKKNKKFTGTVASKDKKRIEHPLNNYEIGLCGTKAGIPYHDPNLSFSNEDIIAYREYEFRHSKLMSSSKYMKLRSMRDEEV